ncbi:MAG: transglycosylase SLT domain-containing protein [Acidobacteria bacterium]|nr:transglycosylase SLT domain-containing protein [Acidobacteriota bacterium]
MRLEPKAVERAREYEKYFSAAAEKYGLDARLLWVIGYLETRFNPNSLSRKGARGLMQLMPATASRFGMSDPQDPSAAIDAAARYLRYLSLRFDGRLDLILAAYNAGETAVNAFLTGRAIQAENKVINPTGRKTGGVPPYRETQVYVTNGLRLFSSIARPAEINALPQPSIAKSRDENATPQVHPQSLLKIGLKSVSYAARSGRAESGSANLARRSIIY